MSDNNDGSNEPAYIARRPCGCIAMVAVDAPEYAKDLAKEIGKCIRKGYAIERVTVGQVRTTHWLSDCPVCKPNRHKTKKQRAKEAAQPIRQERFL